MNDSRKLFRETPAEGYEPVAIRPYDWSDRWDMTEDGVHWRRLTWFGRFPKKDSGGYGDSFLWVAPTTADKAQAWICSDKWSPRRESP